MNTKLVVPVLLGLSLATASAALLYYILRKDEEETTAPLPTEVTTARVNTIEVSVPKNIVPALIGRGGSNIKEIERDTGASIIFKKFPDRDADICIIRGRAASAQLAESRVHEFIRDQPPIVEDSISVPAYACGRIIGSGGENINEISHRSGARVKVESTPGGDMTGQRLVSFRGTTQQIQLARDLVLKAVAQAKCLRDIEASKSPRVATPTSLPEPGEDVAGEQSVRSPPPPHVRRPVGATVEVYVSAVSSPSRFWVQFVGAQTARLDELVDKMTAYYGNKDNREMHALSTVSVGQIVAAVFRHDGRWYRARVLALRPNEFAPEQQVADVIYVDYGDSEYVATHELCELRADLLRLRFQAMECFLAGVRPAGAEDEVVGVTAEGERWDKWHPKAIARFEELTKVARWKSLMSATCTYKRCASAEGDRDKEIPGIRLYDVTDQGDIDIGAVLVAEGWAVETPIAPRTSPTKPFGDLGASRVLGLVNEERSSMPRERNVNSAERLSSEEKDSPPPRPPLPSPASLSYEPAIQNGASTPPQINNNNTAPVTNGSHDLIKSERDETHANEVDRRLHEELKANMNRMDSHHNLQELQARYGTE